MLISPENESDSADPWNHISPRESVRRSSVPLPVVPSRSNAPLPIWRKWSHQFPSWERMVPLLTRFVPALVRSITP